MSIIKSATAFVAGAALSLGAAAWASAASAADMPVKAAATPTVGASVPLDVHGYLEFQFANNRVTPGGLLIYPNRGFLYHTDIGLSVDIYKNPTGFINSFQVFGGIWNEYWTEPPVGGQEWQERDWWVGFTVGFAQHWSFSFSHVQFKLPSGPSAYNYAFSLAYDDSYLGYWLTFNPFVNVFYNAAGFTNIPTGSNTYRVEIGVKPGFSLQKGWDIPLSVSFPTWVTVAPKSYYNRNDYTTNLCGTTGTAPCSLSNARHGLDRPAAQVRADAGAEAARQLVREGRRPVLPPVQRRPARVAGHPRGSRPPTTTPSAIPSCGPAPSASPSDELPAAEAEPHGRDCVLQDRATDVPPPHRALQ